MFSPQVLGVSLLYSGGIPVLYILAAFTFATNFVVDKVRNRGSMSRSASERIMLKVPSSLNYVKNEVWIVSRDVYNILPNVRAHQAKLNIQLCLQECYSRGAQIFS